MIEILVVISFVKRLAAIAESKGRSKSWGSLGAIGWLGGEVIGAFFAVMMGLEGPAIYGCALLAAAIGAAGAYLTVKSLGDAEMVAELAGSATHDNPNYDPRNPYSPPKRD